MEKDTQSDTKNNTKSNTETKEKTSLGLEENIEALLTYALGWVTGIVFLIIEKDNKFVKFHAMQSTIAFLTLTVTYIIFGLIPFIGFLFKWIIEAISIIVWIVCMLEAYEGKKFKLPVVGDIAEKNIK